MSATPPSRRSTSGWPAATTVGRAARAICRAAELAAGVRGGHRHSPGLHVSKQRIDVTGQLRHRRRLRGRAFGSASGEYVFGDCTSSRIFRVALNPSRNGFTGTPQKISTNAGTPADFVRGPDGAIYYAAISDGEVRRLAAVAAGAEAPVRGATLTLKDNPSRATQRSITTTSTTRPSISAGARSQRTTRRSTVRACACSAPPAASNHVSPARERLALHRQAQQPGGLPVQRPEARERARDQCHPQAAVSERSGQGGEPPPHTRLEPGPGVHRPGVGRHALSPELRTKHRRRAEVLRRQAVSAPARVGAAGVPAVSRQRHLLALRLVEAGALDLDAPISRSWPRSPSLARGRFPWASRSMHQTGLSAISLGEVIRRIREGARHVLARGDAVLLAPASVRAHGAAPTWRRAEERRPTSGRGSSL